MAKMRPQVIDDEQHERVYERVAAVDVAKDSGMVCARMPHPSRPGARQSAVWTVKARMAAIGALGRQLKRDGIQMVTLESTSVIRVARGRLRRQVTVRFARSFSCHGRLIWGPSATQTADRGADPAATSRRCRFCPSRRGRVRDGTTWAMSNFGPLHPG